MRSVHQVRSVSFLDRPGVYSEEFDGADFAAAVHLICHYEKEDGQKVGVGTMRIRYLRERGYVAWERFAIRPKVPQKVFLSLVNYARDYCLRKGIHTVLGTVHDERLQRFWASKGARFLNEPDRQTVDGRHWRMMLLPLATSEDSDLAVDTSNSSGDLAPAYHDIMHEIDRDILGMREV